jgi:UDP-N-acetylglucosamine transferase subunit ALG13
MVAEVKARGEIPEEVFIQTGSGGFMPEGLETVETLPFDQMQSTLRDADIVICHGGTGSLITALRQGCRIVAVPRLFSKGEVYDDHQAEITNAFAERGLIAVANTADELSAALKSVRAREPQSATSDPTQLIEHLQGLLDQWGAASPRSLADRKIA